MYNIGDEVGFTTQDNTVVYGKLTGIVDSVFTDKESKYYYLDVDGCDEPIVLTEDDLLSTNIDIGSINFCIGQTVGVYNDNKELVKSKIKEVTIQIDKDFGKDVFYDLEDGQYIYEQEIVYAEPMI